MKERHFSEDQIRYQDSYLEINGAEVLYYREVDLDLE